MNLPVNELRLGNYHYYRIVDERDERKEWDEVCQIDEEDVQYIVNYKMQEEYSPIPLTPEWMPDLGFVFRERIYFEGWYIKVSDRHEALFYFEDRLLRFRLSESLSISFPYVHNLQNFVFELSERKVELVKK